MITPGTEVFVARGGMLYGSILVADRVRDEAAAAVASIQPVGIRTVLLTGDSKAVGDEVVPATESGPRPIGIASRRETSRSTNSEQRRPQDRHGR